MIAPAQAEPSPPSLPTVRASLAARHERRARAPDAHKGTARSAPNAFPTGPDRTFRLYPTLLVDLDPQCNATVALGLPKDGGPSVYDCLSGDLNLTAAALPSGIDGLDIVPSTPDLAGANVELPRISGSETILRDRLGSVRDRYLFTLLDCPPSLGPLTVNALVAADRVIVPVQTEYFALEGLAQLLDTLSLIQRELNPRLTVLGMILTMHDGRTRLARDVEREVREHFPSLVFDTVVPRNVRLSEAPSFGLPVLRHAPHSAGSAAYLKLAKEVAARG